MHYHVPQPFYRKDRNTWYVQIRGRQISLVKDRSQAFQRYYEIMARPDETLQTERTDSAGLLLSQLFDQFLDWVQRNRAKPTYEWYRYRLQRFSDKYPKLTVEQLRPYHVQQWVDGYQNHTRTSNRNYMRTVTQAGANCSRSKLAAVGQTLQPASFSSVLRSMQTAAQRIRPHWTTQIRLPTVLTAYDHAMTDH